MSADPQAYWNIVSDKASSDAYDSSQPFASGLMSVETAVASSADVREYAREFRNEFCKLLAVLSPERREIAIEYFILEKTEEQIAVIHGRFAQGMLGQEIYSIVQSIAARIAMGHRPSHGTILEILLDEGVMGAPYAAQVISDLLESRDFRPDVERTITRIAFSLMEGKTRNARALGVVIRDALISKQEAHRERVHVGRARKTFVDPLILGSFEIDINHPDVEALLAPRAEEVSNASKIRKTA